MPLRREMAPKGRQLAVLIRARACQPAVGRRSNRRPESKAPMIGDPALCVLCRRLPALLHHIPIAPRAHTELAFQTKVIVRLWTALDLTAKARLPQELSLVINASQILAQRGATRVVNATILSWGLTRHRLPRVVMRGTAASPRPAPARLQAKSRPSSWRHQWHRIGRKSACEVTSLAAT